MYERIKVRSPFLFAFVFTVTAFILSLLVLLAGSTPNFLLDAYMVLVMDHSPPYCTFWCVLPNECSMTPQAWRTKPAAQPSSTTGTVSTTPPSAMAPGQTTPHQAAP